MAQVQVSACKKAARGQDKYFVICFNWIVLRFSQIKCFPSRKDLILTITLEERTSRCLPGRTFKGKHKGTPSDFKRLCHFCIGGIFLFWPNWIACFSFKTFSEFLDGVIILQPTDLIGWMELNLLLGTSHTIVYYMEASASVKWSQIEEMSL